MHLILEITKQMAEMRIQNIEEMRIIRRKVED